MDSLGIALLGCGTVGRGVTQLLLNQADRLAARAGRSLVLRKILLRNPAKYTSYPPRELVTSDYASILADPSIEVVAELIGGTTDAKEYVLAALAAGKHVVTANKALLAEHGTAIFRAAEKAGRVVAFEASVAGGVPIIAAIGQSLAANQILSIQGILNGTSNFILTAMADRNQTYVDALAEAQALGYAEADPTLDVDGSDAAHKLAVLVRLGFGIELSVSQINRRGIDQIHSMDLRFAQELGYTIKLLAEAWLTERQVALHVSPVLLRQTSMLAQVRGAFNAIQVVGDVVGETLYQGPGAGMMATASAVVADLIDVAIGRAQRTFPHLRIWSATSGDFRVRDPLTVRSRFYLRLMVADRPGVLADITRLLAEQQISISSVIQHEAIDESGEGTVPLVIMTHSAQAGAFASAVERINRLAGVSSPGVSYTVAD